MTVRWPDRNELAFYVQSSSRHGMELLVRLDEEPWNEWGFCSCEHHEFTVRPAVEKGTLLMGTDSKCRHIQQAKLFFAEEMLRDIQRQRKTPTNEVNP